MIRYVLLTFLVAMASWGCSTKFNEDNIKNDFRQLDLKFIGELKNFSSTLYCRYGDEVFSLNRKSFELCRYRLIDDGSWSLAHKVVLQKGKGPGEFMQPGGFCADSTGKLIVTDSALSRVSVLDRNLICTDSNNINAEGTMVTGDGMADCLGVQRLIISYVHYEKPGKELILFDYVKGEIVKKFGRDVVVSPDRPSSFLSAVGNFYCVEGNIFRMTYEPELYLYAENDSILEININEVLEKYNIKLVKPGVRERTRDVRKKGEKGVKEYGLNQIGESGNVCLSIGDYRNHRFLLIVFDKNGSVHDLRIIKNDNISLNGFTKYWWYDDDKIAFYGAKDNRLELYHITNPF